MARRSRQSGNPISFFSFQDIITSVTGILILVTLMLALELITRADVPEAAVAIPPVRGVAAELQQERRLINLLEQQIRQNRSVLSELADVSPLALATRLEELRAENLRTRALLAGAKQELREVERGKSEQEQKLKGLEVAAVSARAAAKRWDEEGDKLERSGAMAYLPGESRKTPLLVTCAGERIVVARINGDGTISTAMEWSGPEAMDSIMRATQSHDSQREYFVICVKPDAVAVANELILLLAKSGFDVGWEPFAPDATLPGEDR